jgi:magnesium transporter
MNFKDIGNKIVNGDFIDLFNFKRGEKTIHPAEIANILHDLPVTNALKGFNTLPANTQIKVFPYLDMPLQQRIIRKLTPARAGYILNALSSDDRATFFSSLRGIERSIYLGYGT